MDFLYTLLKFDGEDELKKIAINTYMYMSEKCN